MCRLAVFFCGWRNCLALGGSQSYIFAKELEQSDPLTTILTKHTLSNGVEVWYHFSLETGQLESLIAIRTQQRELPVVYTIRDSGHEQLLSAVKSDGAVLYSVSSGHGELLRALISKSILPTGELRRFTALWAHEEFLIGSNVATSEKHIKRFQKCTIDPQK